MASTDDAKRKKHLRDFYRRSQVLLTEEDRNYLYDVLKEYQTHKRVDKLVHSLSSALDTPDKMDLLHEIRNLIPKTHLSYFDQVAPYGRMAHPLMRAKTQSNHRDEKYHHNNNNQSHIYTKDHSHTVQSRRMAPSPRLEHHTRPSNVLHTHTSMNGRGDHGNVRPHSEMHHYDNQRHLYNGYEGGYKYITLVRHKGEPLGFSIRGGSEHGLGIFVSEVTDRSAADLAGLEVGDQIMNINGIGFEKINSSSAVKVIKGSGHLKLNVLQTGKVPGLKYSKEKISWFDTKKGRHVYGAVSERGSPVIMNGSGMKSERKVNLTPTGQEPLGFNIRGGKEFGLGIYVSRVDPGSLADHNGIQEGDMISKVNGVSFESFTHQQAVDFFQSQHQLIVTIKNVGKYPAFKEIRAEYGWIDGRATLQRRPHSAPPGVTSVYHSRVSPIDSGVEVHTQTPPSSHSSLGMHTEQLAGQTDIMMPYKTDIEMYERPYSVPTTEEASQRMTRSLDDFGFRAEKNSPSVKRVQSLNTTGDSLSGKKVRTKVKRSRTFKEMIFGKKKDKEDKENDPSNQNKQKKSLFGGKKKDKEKTDVSPQRGFGSVSSKGSKTSMGGKFGRGVGTQVMYHEAMQGSAVQLVQDMSRKLLNDDEALAIMRHVKRYLEGGSVEGLVQPLLAILDKPEKVILLRDIRGIIYPTDLGRFDSMVSRQELEAYEELATTTVKPSPSMIKGSGQVMMAAGPPKKTLMSPVTDYRGNYQLLTQEEYERVCKRKEEFDRIKQEKKEIRAKTENQNTKHIPFVHLHSTHKHTSPLYEDINIPSRHDEQQQQHQQQHQQLHSETDSFSDDETFTELKAASSKNNSPETSAGKHDTFYNISNVTDDSSDEDVTDGVLKKEAVSKANIDSLYAVVKKKKPSPQRNPDDETIATSEKPTVLPEQMKQAPHDYVPSSSSPSPDLKKGILKRDSSRSLSKKSLNWSDHQHPMKTRSQLSASLFRQNKVNKHSETADNHPKVNAIFIAREITPDNTISKADKDRVQATNGDFVRMTTPIPDDLNSLYDIPSAHSTSDTEFIRSNHPQSDVISEGESVSVDDNPVSASFHQTVQVGAIEESHVNQVSPANQEPHVNQVSLQSHSPVKKESIETLKAELIGMKNTLASIPTRQKVTDRDVYPPSFEFWKHKEDESESFSDDEQELTQKHIDDIFDSVTEDAGYDKKQNGDDSTDSDYGLDWPSPPGTLSSDDVPAPPDKEVEMFGTSGIFSLTSSDDSDANHQDSQLPLFTVPPPPTTTPPTTPPSLRTTNQSHQGTASPVHLENPPYEELEISQLPLTVLLDKHRTSLGLSISGGKDSRSQPIVKVEKIFPGGAAADEGTLQSGMEIISVDGCSVEDVSHPEAVNIIRRAYNNKTTGIMKMVICPKK